MCCGVGNLEVKHSNPRNIYMSTLDQADIDVMKATKTCVAAQRFQYDYLNDDIKSPLTPLFQRGESLNTALPASEKGELLHPTIPPFEKGGLGGICQNKAAGDFIDYSLTNKVPEGLRKAIAEGKKILVLINPPYAEAGSTLGKDGKKKVSANKFATTSMVSYGKASNELFIQFVARIAQEIPSATLAMFSTMKYVNSQNFDKFREIWNAQYLGGFIVHSKAFDGLSGNFPIGFLVWKINQNAKNKIKITEITTEVFDKKVQPIGEKIFYNLPNETFLNIWLTRPKPNNTQVIPLKNTVSPYTSTKYLDKWADNALGYMWCQNNDPQHTLQQTALFSSVWGDGHGFYLTPENIWQAAVIFSVRQLVKHTWINHNDQFLQPNQALTD
jgi:hypothetical protein